MNYKEAAALVAKQLNLPEETVINTYKAYWKFIRDSIESLPLKQALSQDEYSNFKTSINVPSLGKFNCTYSKYLGMRNRYKLIKELRSKQ